MIRLNGFIQKQAQLLLGNSRYATICAVLLALLPYVGWLALVVIALVTLRKGWQEGLGVLLPVVVMHFSMSLISIPVLPALINTLLVFVPCYLAACVLRFTSSWRAVASSFFLLVFVVAFLLQVCFPGFIIAQFVYVKSLMGTLQGGSAFADLMSGSLGISQVALANYLLGIQSMSVVLSTLFPIMLARSVQSQLFYPGAFKQEMLTFRGHKIGVLILTVVLITALRESALAINLLPLLILYFLFAGLSLSANALAHKKTRGAVIFLVVPLMLVPFVMLPVYVILGSLDSLLNLRIYFAQA